MTPITQKSATGRLLGWVKAIKDDSGGQRRIQGELMKPATEFLAYTRWRSALLSGNLNGYRDVKLLSNRCININALIRRVDRHD